MAKKPEGIDDIAKAIMAAIKAARSQASRTAQDVGYQVKRAKVLSNKEVRKSLKTVDGYQKEMWKDMFVGNKPGQYGNPYKRVPPKLEKAPKIPKKK